MDFETTWALKTNEGEIKTLISEIRRLGFAERIKIKKFKSNLFIEISEQKNAEIVHRLQESILSFKLQKVPVELFQKHKKNPQSKLKLALQKLLHDNRYNCDALVDDIPQHWERHGDLLILPNTAFTNEIWTKPAIESELWSVVAKALQCNRIAKRQKIEADDYRTPKIQLLLGDSGRVQHVDNGIRYEFDVTKCMFSAGNITEKLRIANMDCSGEVIVDLYAGIGYFTLPFLIHAGAKHVHACEWNKTAVEALQNNICLNNVGNRCTIHFGDNRQVCPVNVADRVNLGLIPSSRNSWETACRALFRKIGGFLHVHENVTLVKSSKCKGKLDWMPWANQVANNIQTILMNIHSNTWTVLVRHVERVKSYAPHVFHLVVDLECRPSQD